MGLHDDSSSTEDEAESESSISSAVEELFYYRIFCLNLNELDVQINLKI